MILQESKRKKIITLQSKRNLLICVWWGSKKILQSELLNTGKIVTVYNCSEQLAWLNYALVKKGELTVIYAAWQCQWSCWKCNRIKQHGVAMETSPSCGILWRSLGIGYRLLFFTRITFVFWSEIATNCAKNSSQKWNRSFLMKYIIYLKGPMKS